MNRFATARQIDESLLRYFTGQVGFVLPVHEQPDVMLFKPCFLQVAELTAPPFETSFITSFSALLSAPVTVTALRGDLAKGQLDAVRRWLDSAAAVSTVALPTL